MAFVALKMNVISIAALGLLKDDRGNNNLVLKGQLEGLILSTKADAEMAKSRALNSVRNKLAMMQNKLRLDINKRSFEINRLTEQQAAEKRELAELGQLLRQLEADISECPQQDATRHKE